MAFVSFWARNRETRHLLSLCSATIPTTTAASNNFTSALSVESGVARVSSASSTTRGGQQQKKMLTTSRSSPSVNASSSSSSLARNKAPAEVMKEVSILKEELERLYSKRREVERMIGKDVKQPISLTKR
jgi:hypothetical protein